LSDLTKGGSMIKWLQDSYNGLYKVLLEPVTPRRKMVAALVIGTLLGLFWAYVLQPVIFYDAEPRQLHQDWQDEWVRLLADRYASANANIDDQILLRLRDIDDPVGVIDRLSIAQPEYAERLQRIRGLAETAQLTAAAAPQPNFIANILPYILAPLLFAILFVVLTWLWSLFIHPNFIEPILRRRRAGGAGAPDTAVQDMRAVMDQKRAAETSMKTQFDVSDLGKPLMQRMSVYIAGRGQFDDSFSIEDENEKFLGECGAGISETIGVGGQNVTAVEVWLFDKDDFVRTMTGVFASEHAANDPATRSKLEIKGPITLIKPGAVIILETASLRLQATIKEVTYGSGQLPPNSYFEKLTIELAAWRKDAASVPAPAIPTPAPLPIPAPAAPLPPPISAAPQVLSPPPLTGGSLGGGLTPRPFTPPPLPPPLAAPPPPPIRPPSVEDDPFGGTGDFKPIR
jgi:hypothetical protein